MRIELRPWGIKTFSCYPGAIATPIWTTCCGLIDRLRAEPGTTIDDRYGKLIDSVEAISAQSAEDGLPPIKVAQVVETALTAPNPRARYLVGADAKIAARIIARLPEGLRDRLIASRNW